MEGPYGEHRRPYTVRPESLMYFESLGRTGKRPSALFPRRQELRVSQAYRFNEVSRLLWLGLAMLVCLVLGRCTVGQVGKAAYASRVYAYSHIDTLEQCAVSDAQEEDENGWLHEQSLREIGRWSVCHLALIQLYCVY